jgi:hypothetical protein
MSEGPTREGGTPWSERRCPSELLFPEERSLSSLKEPESLRVRAKETRAMAERVTEVAVKLTMLTIAAEYEQLAQRTEDSRSGTMRKD